MTLSSLTAFIFTFHNVAALFMLLIAVLLSLLSYGIFLRKLEHRKLALSVALLFFLFLGFLVTERVFLQKPLNFEVVQVG